MFEANIDLLPRKETKLERGEWKMKENHKNMLTFILFFLLAFCHVIDSYQCGKTISDRIINGKPVVRGTYPWMVVIVNAENTSILQCGASLITTRFVLTAKHCLKGPLKKFKLLLGTVDLKFQDDSVKLYTLSKYIKHPGDDDIALIKTKRPVKMNRYVQPICLPSPGRDYADVQAVVAGYGLNNYFSDVPGKLVKSDVLLAGIVDTTSTANCNFVMPRYNDPRGDELLCAGTYQGEPGVCYGDSGGPLMYFNPETTTWQLIGIVNGGYHCGDPREYSLFANVTYYRDWIISNSDFDN